MHRDKIKFLRYAGELAGAFLLYGLVLAGSIRVGRPMPEGLGRTLVLLSPMVPFALFLVVIVRYFRRVDEYLRLQMLENFAITAGIVGGLTFTYGFLENAGFPRLSMFTVWTAMGVVCAAVFLVRRVAGR